MSQQKRFLIVEVYEENAFTERECLEELIPYLEGEDPRVESITCRIQRVVGTNFFLVPAETYFSAESLVEEDFVDEKIALAQAFMNDLCAPTD